MTQVDLKTHLKALERKLVVVSFIGLLSLLMLSIVLNYVLKEQAATTATSLIRREASRDIREAVYALNEANFTHFSGVIAYGPDGDRLFSLPADLDFRKLDKSTRLDQILAGRIHTAIYFDPDEKSSRLATVVYLYNRFELAPWAFAIWACFLLATVPLIRSSRKRLVENYNREIHFSIQSSLAVLARRVRHDIRSPLSALEIATDKASSVSGEKLSLIIKATNRVKEIVKDLDEIRSSVDESESTMPKQSETYSISSHIKDVVFEKRIQQTGEHAIKIDARLDEEAFLLFSNVDASEFKRTLSNIIQNAIEASDLGGRVQVKAKSNGDQIEIDIIDEGKGIPADVLPRLGERGFKFDKPLGTGLGLHYAIEMAKANGGTLNIETNEPKGTAIRITLPKAAPPVWYTDKIEMPSGTTIVIIDDQSSSRQALRSRFADLLNVTIEEFATSESFSQWQAGRGKDDKARSVYFIDYDLGNKQMTGLDIIEALEASGRTYLVTGHYDHPGIQGRCMKHTVKLIPKFHVGAVAVAAGESDRVS